MPATLSLSGALGHAHADKRIDILRQIGVCGSISQAAGAVGVSYRAAWQALDTLTNLAGAPLVARAVGGAGGGGAGLTAAGRGVLGGAGALGRAGGAGRGAGGGGARLTAAGRELLAAADALALARGAVLARWQAAPDAGPALARLALRTSMRNQLPCTVGPLALQGQIVRVPLRLARTDGAGGADGALDLAARITRESAELLGLQPGLAVQALCKATAVRVERAGAALAAEPGILRLPAKAVRGVRGSSGDEGAAELAAGLAVGGWGWWWRKTRWWWHWRTAEALAPGPVCGEPLWAVGGDGHGAKPQVS